MAQRLKFGGSKWTSVGDSGTTSLGAGLGGLKWVAVGA
jgi:hypothetical protein